jgi:SAM-dependent methyltransferase
VIVWVALRLDPSIANWYHGWRRLVPDTAVILIVGMTVYLGLQMRDATRDSRVLVRNFYGGLRVRDSGPVSSFDSVRTLTNGTINHGEEYLNLARRDLATTYYGPKTGVGIAIRDRQKIGAIRVGVVGLGTGTIASYVRPGDYYRFYELNPLVPPITRSQFFFLADAKGKVEIAMGDARLSLEREAPENFDVLAVDAFSSDSIPVHLLTREAMLLYFRHLKPDGILAVHTSNRYLDLEPVLKGESQATGKIARVVDTDDDDSQDAFGATWVLVASPRTGFDADIRTASLEIDAKKTVRLWTDDYSNLFQILK